MSVLGHLGQQVSRAVPCSPLGGHPQVLVSTTPLRLRLLSSHKGTTKQVFQGTGSYEGGEGGRGGKEAVEALASASPLQCWDGCTMMSLGLFVIKTGCGLYYNLFRSTHPIS